MIAETLQAMIAGFPDSAVVMVGDVRALLARLAEVEAERDETRSRLDQADVALTALDAHVEAAEAELEAARPVVEAAVAYFDEYGWLLAVDRDNLEAMPKLADDPRFKLLAAVDLYRSATSDHPSTTEEKP